MDAVSMDDGLDGPETLVFGLGMAETAALVVALLAAWACVAALPGVLAWPLAVCLAGCGGLLGWGRRDDRTLLAWAVLAVRFGWRQRQRARRRVRAAVAAAVWRARVALTGVRPRFAARHHAQPAPAVVLPLVLPRPAHEHGGGGARVVAVTSLRGGSGRTVLSCALAARLAEDGRIPARRGWRPLRVALLDLHTEVPAAALQWGAPLGGPAQRHRSGALFLSAGGGDVSALVDGTDADVVVVDTPPDGGGLRGCDDVVVLVEPTPAGWLDAYRNVARLRRLGLRDRLLLVANRCDEGADFDELEGDLGIEVAVRIPASADLENDAAVASLAAVLNQRLLGGREDAVDAVAG